MTARLDRLADALVDRYRIEREKLYGTQLHWR